jgi:hypothetical protein
MASLNSCSLIVKRVGDAEYVYAQGRMADGTIRQVYLAPHDDAGRALLQRFRQARADAAGEKSAIGSGEARAASCRGLRLGSWEAGRWAKRARLEARKLWRFKAFKLST